MKSHKVRCFVSALFAVLFLACGGNGSGNSEKGISIAIDSPIEGARIIGSRSIVITGTVGEGASVTVSTNGGAEEEASVSGGTFSATLTLDPRANAIVARATRAGATATATASVSYPFLSLRTFQDASVVIGQPDFQTGSTSTNRFWGNPGWDGSQLYLPDAGRVDAYTGVPIKNGATPSFVLTKVNAGTASATGLMHPLPLAYDGKLVLADSDLDRVLLTDALPSADGSVASVVIGKSSECTRSGLEDPRGIFAVQGKLLVADYAHHRILIWNSIPAMSDQLPDLVLGQLDFSSCEPGVGDSRLDGPHDVWSDGTRVLVADKYNNRILGWSTFPTTNGQAADFVLGQPSFTSNDGGLSQGTFNYPSYLASNGNQLFVVDRMNSRVLVWNTTPSAARDFPEVVLGQADFVHGTANDTDQDGVGNATASANTLNYPFGILALDDALVVSDDGNRRYLVFRSE